MSGCQWQTNGQTCGAKVCEAARKRRAQLCAEHEQKARDIARVTRHDLDTERAMRVRLTGYGKPGQQK